MKMGAVASIVGALAVAILVVGCGGSGGDEELTTATIARAAYLEEVEDICDHTYETVQSQYDEFLDERGEDVFDDEAALEEYTDSVLIPAREQEADEIRELGALKGDDKKIEAILAAYDEGVEEAEEDPENAVKGAYGPWVPAAELVKAYGAEDCSY